MKSAFVKSICEYLKINRPDIELGIGLVFIGASIVKAVSVTKKDTHQIEEKEAEVVRIREGLSDPSFEYPEGKKDLWKAWLSLWKAYARTYASTAALATIGVGFVFDSHITMKERQAYLSGIAMAATKELNDMYSRTKEKYGKDEADNLRYGLTEKEIEAEEDGKKVKKKVRVMEHDPYHDIYSYRWDTKSSTFKTNRLLRDSYLVQMQQYFNDMLAIREQTGNKIGYLYLNEVLTALDIPVSEAGQYVGWVIDRNDPYVDNYVEIEQISIHETNPVSGALEEVIYLSFNVDGPIINRMFRKPKS